MLIMIYWMRSREERLSWFIHVLFLAQAIYSFKAPHQAVIYHIFIVAYELAFKASPSGKGYT